MQQGRQYILPEQDGTVLSEDEEEEEEEDEEEGEVEEPFSRIVIEEKYHDDREDDFLNGKVTRQQ